MQAERGKEEKERKTKNPIGPMKRKYKKEIKAERIQGKEKEREKRMADGRK